MRLVTVRKAGSPEPLAQRVGVADRFWYRLRGLLGTSGLSDEEGLILRPCKGIHTWGMRYPIDVAFVDRSDRVVASYPGLGPNSRTSWHSNAIWALELPAGALGRAQVTVGDRLACEEVSA